MNILNSKGRVDVMKQGKKWAAWLLCLVMMLACLPAMAEAQYTQHAYIAYERPDPSSTVVCSISQGTRTEGVLGSTNDGWTLISFSMGGASARGWIYSAAFTADPDSLPSESGVYDASGYDKSRLTLQIVTVGGVKTATNPNLTCEELDENRTVGKNVTAGLYAQPAVSGMPLATFPEGTAVRLLRKTVNFNQNGGIYYVSVDGKQGYMSSAAFRDADATPAPAPDATPTAAPAPTATAAPGTPRVMYVRTGNTGKLYLRQLPTKSSAVLGSYANGTAVTVYSQQNGWAQVQVNGKYGYMMVSYLTDSLSSATASPATPAPGSGTVYYVRTGNTGKLYLRVSPWQGASVLGKYANGTPVTVYSIVNGWAYVDAGDVTGYMMAKFLTPSAPSVTAAPAPTAQPGGTPIGILYVRTGNSGRLHLRALNDANSASLGLYANGTQVLAYAYLGDWVQVGVNGKIGYMMKKFLTDGSVTPAPTMSPTYPPVYGKQMVVRTGNSGRLNLRAAPDQNAASLGLYANGTWVNVVAMGTVWAQVTVGDKAGYMMVKFLSDGTTPSNPATPSTGSATIIHPKGSYVNFRSSMSAANNYNVILRLHSGTRVELIARYDGWCRVRYNGQAGYVMSYYVH